MRILFLDDCKERQLQFLEMADGHHIDLATTSIDAIIFLSRFQYDMIYLDHDLEGNTTAVVVAHSLAGMTQHHGCVVILHTFSDTGAAEMYALLQDKYNVWSRKQLGDGKCLWMYKPSHLCRAIDKLSQPLSP